MKDGFCLKDLCRSWGSTVRSPTNPPGLTLEGASFRIDYILFSGGTRHPVWSAVLQDSDAILGTDHKCCMLALQELRKSAKGRAFNYTKQHRCGKWKVDLAHAPNWCDALYEQLECLRLPLTDGSLQGLAEQSCADPPLLGTATAEN